MKITKIVAIIATLCIAISLLISCAKPVVVMEYKNETVSANMYSYWLSQIKSSYVSASNDTDEYWATKYSNGQTYEEKMREIVDFNVKVNLICQSLFAEMGLSVSDKEVEEIKSSLADLLESYGSKSQLNSFLSKYNINYDMLEEIYMSELKTTHVYNALYAKGGSREVSEEDVDKYFKDNYTGFDIIMIFNTVEYEKDENGAIKYDETTGSPLTKELTEDEKKAKEKIADEIMTKLENGESFAELSEKYNEDPNKDLYKEGYFISSNDISVYGTEILTAVQSMKTGEVKKVNDSSTICIIKTKELVDKIYNDEDYKNQLGNLKDYCQQSDFNVYMTELAKNVVVNEEELSKISIKEAELMA